MQWSAFWDGLKKRDASKVLHTWATWNAEGYFLHLGWEWYCRTCKRCVLGVSYIKIMHTVRTMQATINRTVRDRLWTVQNILRRCTGHCRICRKLQDGLNCKVKKVHLFKGLKQIIMSSLMCFKFFHRQGAHSFGPFTRGLNKYIEEILIVNTLKT